MTIRTGADWAKLLADKRGAERQALIMNGWKNREVPAWIITTPWIPLTVSQTFDDGLWTLTYPVMADGLALGTDADSFPVGLFADNAQAVADDLYAVMPTRKMLRDIATAATRIPFQTPGFPWYKAGGIPGDIESTGAWIDAFVRREKIYAAKGITRGQRLAEGGQKTLVNRRGYPLGSLAIQGGLVSDALPLNFVQKEYSGHKADYDPDYSHKEQYASRKGLLTGPSGVPDAVDLMWVARHPKFFPLLSDEGPLELRYPNVALPWPGGAAPDSSKPATPPGATKAPPPKLTKPALDVLRPAEPSGEMSFLILGMLGLGLLAAKLVAR
jgi:hypothetical protein